MHVPIVNSWAVLIAAAVIFILGGLWYSPALFGKRWMELMGKSGADLESAKRRMPAIFASAFVLGIVQAYALAVVMKHVGNPTLVRSLLTGLGCWVGFAGATSYTTALFAHRPKMLWAIDSGYNLVSFLAASIVLGTWP